MGKRVKFFCGLFEYTNLRIRMNEELDGLILCLFLSGEYLKWLLFRYDKLMDGMNMVEEFKIKDVYRCEDPRFDVRVIMVTELVSQMIYG